MTEFDIQCNNIIDNKKVHMITYGDDKFYDAKKVLCDEAVLSKFFYSIKSYSRKNLSPSFLNRYETVLNMPRGGGYFIWRGDIIIQRLEEIDEGDFLIYNDSGNTINSNGRNKFIEYINKLNDSPYGLLWFQTSYTEKNWTTKEIFDYFNVNLNSSVSNTGQHWIGCLIIQKNEHSMNIFKKYLQTLEDNVLLFTDEYNSSQTHKFTENRHDQSILSVISKIDGCVSILPTRKTAYEGSECDKNIPFWATHRRDGKKNGSYVSEYNGGKLHGHSV